MGAGIVATPKPIDMLGGRLGLIAQLGPAEDDAALFRATMAPGRLVPLHGHRDPECFHVISGRLEVFLLDHAPGWRPVEAGRSLLVDDGVKHAVRNGGDDAVDLILLTTNRMARFFVEASRPAAAGAGLAPTPTDVEHVARVARAYGYWLASPAESNAVTG